MMFNGSSASSFKQGMFRRIPQSEKKRILSSLGEHRIPISVKGKNDEIFSMITDGLEDDRLLHCRMVAHAKKPTEDHPVVVNFTFGYERYFFQGFMTAGSDKWFIDATSDFYILQRRKSARMILPAEFPAGFNIIEHRQKSVFHELKVVDFSSGGLKVFYPDFAPEFQSGEVIKGALHLGKRRPINLSCTVRHVVRKEKGDEKGQSMGLQFDPIDKIMEVKLLTVFMDLQREIFLKYSK